MTAADACLWDFDGDLADDSFVRCPECGKLSALALWREGEVYCDDCGEHAAMVCPSCSERFDHVRGPKFEVCKQGQVFELAGGTCVLVPTEWGLAFLPTDPETRRRILMGEF